MQQPAAYQDEIISAWCIQDQAQRLPQAIHQRDLFAAVLGDTAKKNMQLAQTIPTWIASKMTPCLQLTDTDIAFPVKCAATAEKQKLAREMRTAALNAGIVPSFRCGPAEILKISQAAHQAMVATNLKDKVVLKGLRRNGMLSWRPDLVSGKLTDPSNEEWCKDMPVGSHRLKDSWLTDRMHWIDSVGRPLKPDWSRSEQAHEEADLAEADYCSKLKEHLQDHSVVLGGQTLDVPVVDIDCDEQSLFEDADALQLLHPKLR